MADLITDSEDSFIKNEAEDALPGDIEKPIHFLSHLLPPKREDVHFVNLPSISGPCKFEYDTQESELICSNNEGHFSTTDSGLHLQGNMSLYFSKKTSASDFSNAYASESEPSNVCDQTFSHIRNLKTHQRMRTGNLDRCSQSTKIR
ncbi:uncharacterized protein LOC136027520 isoform X2 [Artemia franciscana]|uniref:uncharacterized protein LOC136027520 isoform X2 n=1 Tax=Artemia franciscana TaxID=6661 RepID=UPI0032DB6706